MSDEMQFDCTLGGPQKLPDRVNLLSFTTARTSEIKAMKQALQASTGTKLAFQRLPKHMRRRVMSHNAKRLPRRLREIHLNQLKKSGMPPKQKRPSRKYRRRPRNLLDDYARRQRKHKWLETHIWHAKRFHMVEKWGYRLADRPCDKAFRACYRATAKHCLVQDLSYFSCLEIRGPLSTLINGFKTICDSNTGLSIGAKAYINGNREGQVELFHNDASIKKAIGKIYFQWKPVETDNPDFRVIWMWIHAAYYSESLEELTKCFSLKRDNATETYINKITKVQLTELKNSLNRFRLTGPLALSVLHNTLKPISAASTNSTWFENYIKSSRNSEIFTKQCKYWNDIKNISSSAELSPHLIFSLIVTDPRFNLPKTKTKAVLDWADAPNDIEVPNDIATGLIWDADIRKSVKDNKISNAKLCELRSELLVPGTELEAMGEAVPVMLVQQPGSKDKNILGYSNGWDLIIPSGWGNTFWMSLIMWGGRAGGLREFDSIQFESGALTFLAPDTQAGHDEENKTTERYTRKFFGLPPNKRPNYTKLGMIEPFNFNWKILIRDWKSNIQTTVNEFFVLRDKKILRKIHEMFVSKAKPTFTLDYDANCIVPVRIKLNHKGTARQFARIYLAELKDLVSNKEPAEPVRADKNQVLRKQSRDAHKTLLKRLRRKRVKAKQKEKVIPKDEEILQNYHEQMKRLWLPEIEKDIRTSCSRQMIGFVTSGSFSYTKAHGYAVGYIAMGSVKVLLTRQHRNKVLVRNISSRQYRFANLEIIL